ncbi:hypothetical protein D9619_004742 [Psilocybe cf. subviscida]|uniref:CDP-diacylglycerol--glycerol-3-phosphate 3-phosphatidyltransferase n=1 Tax=Psilocybe cf. subviscida TaxID=2480587 RepID=A0A8H5F7K9_9AGAR|nr:hypothetical protein D9619_004742 [Psilocybe cf. subviscida]
MWRFIRPILRPISSCRRRCISTTHLHPSVRDFTASLAEKQPVLQIDPTNIRILNQPSQFYANLLDMINAAERRIFLSTLYIGAEETELIDTLIHRLRVKPELKLTLILDFNRSTRPGKDSTANTLLPLLQQFPERVTISMFRSPSLRGILAKVVPPRFNEGWGTWHAKVYGADDDVMISGANLNKSYFTDRQDRYIRFSDEPLLAQYCFDFLSKVSSFSYNLLPTQNSAETGHADNLYLYSSGSYTLTWPDSNSHPHQFHSLAQSTLSQFQNSYRDTTTRDEPTNPSKALLIPVIQAGQFNIREEENVFHQLFRYLARQASRSLLDLTSGYFSIYPPYQRLILNVPNVDCRIVAAAPKANGFYGSKGVSGRIPEGYTLYEQRFMRAVSRAGKLWKGPSPSEGHGVLLNEWEKPGWTYHAKGIWLTPTADSSPTLTLFGSTNLNSRSAHIDTELSFVMVLPASSSSPRATGPDPDAPPPTTKTTRDGNSAVVTSASPSPMTSEDPMEMLRRDLAREIGAIRANAGEWKGGERKVRWTTQLIVWLVKGML